jgi:alpha-D-ribose 1-methylphosphonate 5-triphosphate synthase subunit PhnG
MDYLKHLYFEPSANFVRFLNFGMVMVGGKAGAGAASAVGDATKIVTQSISASKSYPAAF